MSMTRLWYLFLAAVGIGYEEMFNINRRRLFDKYDDRRQDEREEVEREFERRPKRVQGHYDATGNYIPEAWNAKYFRGEID